MSGRALALLLALASPAQAGVAHLWAVNDGEKIRRDDRASPWKHRVAPRSKPSRQAGRRFGPPGLPDATANHSTWHESSIKRAGARKQPGG